MFQEPGSPFWVGRRLEGIEFIGLNPAAAAASPALQHLPGTCQQQGPDVLGTPMSVCIGSCLPDPDNQSQTDI